MSTNYTHWFIRARLKTRQLLLLMALEEEGNIHRAACAEHDAAGGLEAAEGLLNSKFCPT